VITIEQCKNILNKGERKYNEEEIKNVRDYLYFIGELQLNNNEN
jgi:hypothetical protein